MTKKVKKIVGGLFLLLLVAAVSTYSYRAYRKTHGVYVETVKQDKGGWGYKIYVKGKVVINQHVMPALPESKPFPTEQTAQQTAELVVHKVRKGGLPTISVSEMNDILRENGEK